MSAPIVPFPHWRSPAPEHHDFAADVIPLRLIKRIGAEIEVTRLVLTLIAQEMSGGLRYTDEAIVSHVVRKARAHARLRGES